MAFELFRQDLDGQLVPTSFDDLDNKQFWCKLGNKQEEAFVNVMNQLSNSNYSVSIHPNKKIDAYHPDLLVTDKNAGVSYVGEVKIKNSPLFFGQRYDVNPQYALTMDLKDSFNYLRWLKLGIDIRIFIWVSWEAHVMKTQHKTYSVKPMKGIWTTTFSKLRDFEVNNKPKIHWYKENFRIPPQYQVNENNKWCEQLRELDPRLTDQKTGVTTNITSNGYMISDGVSYPAGHSSGSYVFDLSNQSLFENIIFRIKK